MSTDSGALPGWFRRETEHRHEDAADHQAAGAAFHHSDQEPVVVWEAANRLEATVVAGRLRSRDIPAVIRGEILGDIYGLTFGSLAATAVLVPAALAEKALAILDEDVDWEAQDDTHHDMESNAENGSEHDTDRG